MSDLQQLFDRNQQFATTYKNNMHIMPRLQTIVLTCADARTDPAHFLGIELGDALVFRNAGARITDEIELELGILWTMANKMAGDQFRGFELAIMHHNDCGFERLANPDLAGLISQKLAVEKKVIDKMAVADHVARIHADIRRLRKSAIVPQELVVSGHLYDLHTGLVNEVVGPTPLGVVQKEVG